MKTVKEIVEEYLRGNGHDGLCNQRIECGCSILDLMPCDWDCVSECVTAKKVLQDDGDWLMFPAED